MWNRQAAYSHPFPCADSISHEPHESNTYMQIRLKYTHTHVTYKHAKSLMWRHGAILE